MKLMFILLAILNFNDGSYASNRCLVKSQVLEGTEFISNSTCKLKTDLQLVTPDYERSFQYWDGTYSKEILEIETYLQVINDICLVRRVSSKRYQIEKTLEFDFRVNNPHLDTLLPSYANVPMTEAEAAAEMQNALDRCNSL